jgi:hypothetical protein
MVDNDYSARIARKAFEVAKDFFQPPSEWDVTLYSIEDAPEWLQDEYPSDAQACVHISHQSLKARILYDPERIDDEQELWASIAHEVAHLLMTDSIRLGDQYRGNDAKNAEHALEVTTIRLERLFLRERPYPGDDAFRQKEAT